MSNVATALQRARKMPVTRANRMQRVIDIIVSGSIHSQAEILEILKSENISITQATLSRDLDEMGALKVKSPNGGKGVYVIPQDGKPITGVQGGTEKLRKLLADLLISAEACGTMVVVRTPPGAAGYLASAIDRANLEPVAGCIAGDDTIFVQARHGFGGEEVASLFSAVIGSLRNIDRHSKPGNCFTEH